MPEKIKWTFERSKVNPKLEDIQIEVELTPEELQLVLEIRQLEDDPVVRDGMISGSGYVREYLSGLRIPFGGRLANPREQLMEDFKKSRDYIRQHQAMIARQTPGCSEQMQLIGNKISKILGDEDPSSIEARRS